MDRFNGQDPDSFDFLLSTRAGGVGINLVAADTCIIFDSDWNPQNDVQAMARCHRIGQKKQVTIYRLITRNTFEAEMFERAGRKLGLEQAILSTHDFNSNNEPNSNNDDKEKDGKVDAAEMELLLRRGAYAMMDDDEVTSFCEDDIDSILSSRSRKIVEEKREKTESWLSKRKEIGRHKVSKSTFTASSSSQHANVDVDDPEFWKKVLPQAATVEELTLRLNSIDNVLSAKKFHSDLKVVVTPLLNTLPSPEVLAPILTLLALVDSRSAKERSLQCVRKDVLSWASVLQGSRKRACRDDFDERGGGGGGGSKRGGSKRSGSGTFREWNEEDDDDDLDDRELTEDEKAKLPTKEMLNDWRYHVHEMKTIKTTEGRRLRSTLEQAIELAIASPEVRTDLNGALMSWKSTAPGIMKKAAIAVLEKYGGY
jgi:hypothetical protein